MRCLLLLCASLAFGQGTLPKAHPEDYPVHARAGSAVIAAEYMAHSFSGAGQMYLVKDYVVVEAAVFPAPGQPVKLDASRFHLRLNGKREPLGSVPATMVAVSLQHPEWTPGRTLEMDAGLGNAGVRAGGPPVNDHPFPGAPEPHRLPTPPRAPKDDRTGLERPEPVSPSQLVLETALPEGERAKPAAGFVYFPYKGKLSSVKTLSLVYEDVVLKLK
jgi:hypothetical protein